MFAVGGRSQAWHAQPEPEPERYGARRHLTWISECDSVSHLRTGARRYLGSAVDRCWYANAGVGDGE